MLTTTVAGRTWDFSHAIGRELLAGNGFSMSSAVAVAPGDILYVLNRGFAVSRGPATTLGVYADDTIRIGKMTIDEEFIGDFGQGEFTWPAALAVADDGKRVRMAKDSEGNVLTIGDAAVGRMKGRRGKGVVAYFTGMALQDLHAGVTVLRRLGLVGN